MKNGKIIGMGNSPIANFLSTIDFSITYIYPKFFDDKKSLIERNYNAYIKKVWQNKDKIKIALYPDYVYFKLPLPKDIQYIIPCHDLPKDRELYKRLVSEGFDVWLGFASNKKYRNYTVTEFLELAKGLNAKTWYLGVSTKRELNEVLVNGFDGFDFTTMLFGRFSQIKDREFVVKKIRELENTVTSWQNRATITDFLEKV